MVTREKVYKTFSLIGMLQVSAMEPHLDPICQSLLHKSGENVLFIRQDVDRYVAVMPS